MWASKHKRNVRGMHDAPRCEALTAADEPCGSPAVKGKKHCHVHGGKGSKSKSYGRQFGDYAKAALQRDIHTSAEIKRLDKVIRKLEREGAAPAIIAETKAARRGLLTTTQQREVDLAAAYTLSPADRERAENEAAELAYTAEYSASGRRSFDMIRDRALGAMLGLAIGEAVGITLQGWERDTGREISDMYGGGILGLQAGHWAAGTAMALALMESLALPNQFDETDFMERLLEWQEDGVYTCTGSCIGIDRQTARALARYKEMGNPIAGDRHPDNLGTGSLVRMAPVAIRYWNNRVKRHEVAARQSRTTHAAPAEVDACLAFAEILADAISGSERFTVLGARYVPNAPSIASLMEGWWKGKCRDDIRSNDNVLHALKAALWCVDTTETFESAVLRATNLGENAATTAALTGQLAGALYGSCGIPVRWLERVARHDEIVEQIDVLLRQSKPARRRGRPPRDRT